MTARDRVEAAARSRLEIGEPLLAGGFAWIAFPRAQVSSLFLARKPHLVGITDRRVLIWARPPKGRPAEDKDLLLDAPLRDVTVDGVRAHLPMLQVRITTAVGGLIVEFRPRDRRLGHRLAQSAGDGAANPAPPAPEVSATT